MSDKECQCSFCQTEYPLFKELKESLSAEDIAKVDKIMSSMANAHMDTATSEMGFHIRTDELEADLVRRDEMLADYGSEDALYRLYPDQVMNYCHLRSCAINAVSCSVECTCKGTVRGNLIKANAKNWKLKAVVPYARHEHPCPLKNELHPISGHSTKGLPCECGLAEALSAVPEEKGDE